MVELKIRAIKNEFCSFKPFFDGNDFSLWKHKMEFFLDSDGIELWDVVESGFCFDKPRGDWNENDFKLFSLNLKAMQVLRSCLSDDVYAKISSCLNAHDI